MSVLKSSKNVEKLWLPSTASLPDTDPNKDWVEFDTSPQTVGDMFSVDNSEATPIEKAVRALVTRIKSWSFVDEAGLPVPVSFEAIQDLDIDDYIFLSGKTKRDEAGIPADQKKA